MVMETIEEADESELLEEKDKMGWYGPYQDLGRTRGHVNETWKVQATGPQDKCDPTPLPLVLPVPRFLRDLEVLETLT